MLWSDPGKFAGDDRGQRIAKSGTAGFSALCRAGADMAMGDALLFISRDAELIEPNTLYALSSQGEREGAAAAGCMLISPQGTLIAAGGAISKDGKIIYPADNERITQTVRTVSVLSGLGPLLQILVAGVVAAAAVILLCLVVPAFRSDAQILKPAVKALARRG